MLIKNVFKRKSLQLPLMCLLIAVQLNAQQVPSTGKAAVNKSTESIHRNTDSLSRSAGSSSQAAHPYKLVPPYLYRAFLPDSGPASIAVTLPDSLSYCWDAGNCRLRYAWSGGFLDMSDLWSGHRQALAKILGTVFYRDKTLFPLRIGADKTMPSVKFKGYRLIDQYPEFHYTVNEIDVYEIIRAKPGGKGLIRTFRIPQANQPISFVFQRNDGVDYSFPAGKRQQELLTMSPAEAREFTVIMTIKGSGK